MTTEFTVAKPARCAECHTQRVTGSKVFMDWLHLRMFCGWQCLLRWEEQHGAAEF